MNMATQHHLDITKDICPMTFVKVKLLTERMRSGETAHIILQGSDPTINIPASIPDLGLKIIDFSLDLSQPDSGTYRLVVYKP